jgi:hypothetical protein
MNTTKSDKIEILLQALAVLNRSHVPTSDAFKLKNPLLIKSFALPGKHDVDDDGRRRFSSIIAGMKAGAYDLQLKVSGKSRAGLKPTDTIENLCRVYGRSDRGAMNEVANFLKSGLNDDTITTKTPLRYFTTDGEKKNA